MSNIQIPPELIQLFVLILGALITAAVPVITVAVYRLITAKVDEFKHRLSVEQLAAFNAIVVTVVKAAEQSGVAGLIEKTGAAMKDYAVNALQEIVDNAGWKISAAQIEASIEAAIQQGLQKATTSVASVPAVTTTTTTSVADTSVPGMGITPPTGTPITEIRAILPPDDLG